MLQTKIAAAAIAAWTIATSSASGTTIATTTPAQAMEAIYVFDSRGGRSFTYVAPSMVAPGTEVDASQLANCVGPVGVCQDVVFNADGTLMLTTQSAGQSSTSYYHFSPDSFSTPGTYDWRGRTRRGIDTGHLAVLWVPADYSTQYLYDFESAAAEFLFLSPTLIPPGAAFRARDFSTCRTGSGHPCSDVSFLANGDVVVGYISHGRHRNDVFDYSAADFSRPGIYLSDQGSASSTLRITEIPGLAAQSPEPGSGVLLGLAVIAFAASKTLGCCRPRRRNLAEFVKKC
jgi:hypothetical protein